MIGKATILAVAMLVPGVAFAAAPAAGTAAHETVDVTAKKADAVKADVKADAKADTAAKPDANAVKTVKAKTGKTKAKAAPAADKKTDSEKKTESKS